VWRWSAVTHAGLAGQTFFARGMEVELDGLISLTTEGDAVGTGHRVELNCVSRVDDIDGKRLVVDIQAGHIGGRFPCLLDINGRFSAAALASVESFAHCAPMGRSVFTFVRPPVTRGFSRCGQCNESG